MARYFFSVIFLLIINIVVSAQDNKDTLSTHTDSLCIQAKDSTGTMSLLFVGDIMGHGPQIRAAYNSRTKSYNYDTVFHYIKDVLSKPDFTIANLEVTLAGPVYKGYPQFSSPDALAEAVKKAGVDVLVTANNHSCDRRLQGINRTIDVLDTLGITRTGTFKNKASRDTNNLIVLQKDALKAGILNYTYGTNGIPATKPAIVNLIDTAIMHADIDKAKKDSLDKLIVVLHFGKEYQRKPNAEQKKLVRYLFSIGADIIIGSHPHVIQKMEYFPENTEKEKFVAYSLGNFVSNQRKTHTDGGVLAQLTLKKEKGKTRIDTCNYILTWVYKKPRTKSLSHYFILPAAQYENQKDFFANPADYQKMKLFIKNSRALLNSENVNTSEYIFPAIPVEINEEIKDEAKD